MQEPVQEHHVFRASESSAFGYQGFTKQWNRCALNAEATAALSYLYLVLLDSDGRCPRRSN